MSFRATTASLAFVSLLVLTLGAAERRVPTVDDLLTVRTIGSAQISPDGGRVAYTVSETDFAQDAFVTQIWMAETATGRTVQLTRGDKPASNPKWSPNGKWLAFISPRVADRNQVFAIRPDGGEAVQLTKSETAISSFSWSRDGKTLAFTAPDAPTEAQKSRKEHLGDYEVVRRDYQHVHLWTLDVEEALRAPEAGRQRTKGKDFSVTSFSWAPDDRTIAFSATVNPDLINGATADIYVLSIADDRVKKIVDQPGPDNAPQWSPDGREIAFVSAMGRDRFFALTPRIAIVAADGGTPRSLSETFDEMPSVVDWTPAGLYFTALQKTASHLFRLDPATGAVARVSAPDDLMGGSFTLSADGRRVAYTAGSPRSLPELFVSDVQPFAPRSLTDSTTQAAAFVLGTREVISWKSKDGATIEGVLIKPADFDPGKRYPLLCIIHGGPTGIDRPVLLAPDTRYYPSDIWVARGALVLKVNYRGSAGYGEKFRTLNVAQPRGRRCVGRDLRRGFADRERLGRSGQGRVHGLEPGWLHLRVPDDVVGSLSGDLGRRRHFELGHVLLQHRHHAVHHQLPRRRSGRRSGDLSENVADVLHQAGDDADADSARRARSPRADSRMPTSCGRASRIAACRSR